MFWKTFLRFRPLIRLNYGQDNIFPKQIYWIDVMFTSETLVWNGLMFSQNGIAVRNKRFEISKTKYYKVYSPALLWKFYRTSTATPTIHALFNIFVLFFIFLFRLFLTVNEKTDLSQNEFNNYFPVGYPLGEVIFISPWQAARTKKVTKWR